MPLTKPRTLSQRGVPLAGTSSRGAAADAQREFSPAAAHGNVRLYTAESANTAGLRGLFHNVCCFTLNPSFHLLYLRGRFWQALLQGELLQCQRCCPSLMEDLQPQRASCYSRHTLLTLTFTTKHFPALSPQLQPSCPFVAHTALHASVVQLLAFPAMVPGLQAACLELTARELPAASEPQGSAGSHGCRQHQELDGKRIFPAKPLFKRTYSRV